MVVTLHVTPCLAIDAVNTNETDESAVNKAGKHPHHIEVLIVVKTSVLGWKDQYRMPLVAISFIFHITPEGVAVFFYVVDVHILACT